MGTKDKPEATNKVGAGGCLNDSKNLVNRYIGGEMSETQWKSSIDCVNESLDFFTDYVRGTNENSYTQGDMYTLISRFLITNNPVHSDLVRAAFSLKSALFGGNSSEFTKEEIEVLKAALIRLRDITSDLIPYLRLRQNPNPSNAELLEMVGAFKRAGDQLADFVNTLPVGMFSGKALETLLTELTTSLDLPVIDNLGELIMLAKWMAFNSRRDVIEQGDWAEVFRIGMGAGGLMLAYKTAVGTDVNSPRHDVMNRIQNDYQFREFLWQLALEARPYISDSLKRHGGATPFPLFDHIIDELPNDILNDIPKPTLKRTLRPLFTKLFQSGTPIGVDDKMIDTIYNLFGGLVKDLGQLDRFYEFSGVDHFSVQPEQLKTALTQYSATLTGNEQARFNELKKSMLSHEPRMYRDSGSILYADNIGYSKLQNMLVLLFEPVLNHVRKTYGSGSDYFIDSDLTLIFYEYRDLLFALKFYDPTSADYGKKRHRDIDLFTPISNGDGKASISEVVEYAFIVISAAELTTKMRNEITPNCENLGQDIMGWTRIPAECFRRHFNDRLAYWLDYFPRTKAYWQTLTPAQQTQAMTWLEHGSRRNGFSNGEIDKYDFGSLAAILHYTESMFTRFDVNRSEVLSKSEIGLAFPVFKNLLAEKANGLKGNYLLKGIFTYIVKYKEMPVTSGIGPIAKLGWWLAVYTLPTTKYSAERSGIFNIVCQLAAPESADQAAKTPQICAP